MHPGNYSDDERIAKLIMEKFDEDNRRVKGTDQIKVAYRDGRVRKTNDSTEHDVHDRQLGDDKQ